MKSKTKPKAKSESKALAVLPPARIDVELKAIKKVTKQELVTMGNIILLCTTSELKAIRLDPSSQVLSAMVASLALKVINKGDVAAYNALLDRVAGPVATRAQLEHSNPDGSPLRPAGNAQVVLYIPKNGSTKEEMSGEEWDF